MPEKSSKRQDPSLRPLGSLDQRDWCSPKGLTIRFAFSFFFYFFPSFSQTVLCQQQAYYQPNHHALQHHHCDPPFSPGRCPRSEVFASGCPDGKSHGR
jgi:hypothetical protein